jgi:hypothetical protein
MTEPTTQPDPGATPPAPPTEPAPPPATGDKPLGEAGEKALAEERAARKALEKQVAALAPLAGLAEALGVKPNAKTDVQALTDQIDAMKRDLADERSARMREQVATAAKLPPELATRLRGSTREELEADAAALAALIPAASATPGTPAPDPTQGARGGTSDLEARLAQAEKDGRTGDVIHLKTQLAEQKAKARN